MHLLVWALIAAGLQLGICNELSLFIGVKTSGKYHNSRLPLLLKTWVTEAPAETYIFTDGADAELQRQLGAEHLIVTGCGSSHQRADLCCKTWSVFQRYLRGSDAASPAHGPGASPPSTAADWLCLADDDTYVNLPVLRDVLSAVAARARPDQEPEAPAAAAAAARHEFYVGRPSVARRLKLPPMFARAYPDISRAAAAGGGDDYLFATGGAGVCMSRAAVRRLAAHLAARNESLQRACYGLGTPDDMSLGVIFETALGIKLRVSELLHSHLEHLPRIVEPLKQATLSYVTGPRYGNTVDPARLSKVLPVGDDPSRLLSVHCSRFPSLAWCASLG